MTDGPIVDRLAEMTGDNLPNDDTPQAIDARLREGAREFGVAWERLRVHLIEARAREIHAELGFASWPDYIADVIRTEMPNVNRMVEQRRELVALLAGERMSQRAIADTVGVSQKTVDRDLDQLSHDDSVVLPDEVIGLDNKERPAHPPQPPPRPQPKPQPKSEPTQRDKDLAVLSGLKGTLADLRLWAAALLDEVEETREVLTRVRVIGFSEALDDCRQVINDVTEAQAIIATFLQDA